MLCFSFMWQICGYVPQTLGTNKEITLLAAKLTSTFFMETFIHSKEKVGCETSVICGRRGDKNASEIFKKQKFRVNM